MSHGPLGDPRLQAVAAALDSGQLEAAQSMLAALDDLVLHRQGTTYLTTRLLFQRGRLTTEEVAQRMRQVLRVTSDFPEAQALLSEAERGTLSPGPRLSTEPAHTPADAPAPSGIPPAPAVPRFTASESGLPSPSQAPEAPELVLTMPFGSKTPEPVPATFARSTQDTEPSPPPAQEAEALALGSVELDDSPANNWTTQPAAPLDQTPTIFSVLTLLDEHRYVEALMALNASSNRSTPELTLMRARALLGAGRREEARETVEQLCQSAPIGPELRAGCARLLIEAGEVEFALEQAEVAFAVAGDSPAIVLTTAWAMLRVARRDEDAGLRESAEQLLRKLNAAGGTTPALASALWATIWADKGDAKQALQAAHRALEFEPHSVEALVAEAVANAMLGKTDEAASAWRRLLAVNQEEALNLRPRLARLGAELERVSPSLVPSAAEPISRRVWDPLETALVSGEPASLLETWEADCAKALAESGPLDADSFRELGHEGAKLLTRAPGFCHFAPYDLSLWSLFRLQVALDLLFGTDKPESGERIYSNSELVLAAYIGESVRQAYEGSWRAVPAEPRSAHVEARGSTLVPVHQIQARLREGAPLALDEFAPLEIAHRELPEWSRRVEEQALPPTPWAPAVWPTIQEVGTLGRALSRSVVGLYCERFTEQVLDHTERGLPALDSYLTLIAPPHAPSTDVSASLTRVAVLVGAYTGEVLRRLTGGEWVSAAGTEGASYMVRMGGVTARPIQHALERLRGHSRMSLTEYVRQLSLELGF